MFPSNFVSKTWSLHLNPMLWVPEALSGGTVPAAGRLYDFQDPNATDEWGQTAALKASRTRDLAKLEILALGCADFNKADSHLN